MDRYKEQYLLELLDGIKRLIITDSVLRERRLYGYKESHSKDGEPYARRLVDVMYDDINNRLLTALMINLGYRIPKDIYSLTEYGDLIEWLGSDSDASKDRKWEDE